MFFLFKKYININIFIYLYEMIKYEFGNVCSFLFRVSKDEGDISFIEFNVWDYKREFYNNFFIKKKNNKNI